MSLYDECSLQLIVVILNIGIILFIRKFSIYLIFNHINTLKYSRTQEDKHSKCRYLFLIKKFTLNVT